MTEKRGRDTAVPQPGKAPTDGVVDKRRRSRKILLIDDEEIVTSTVGMMLRTAGYDPVVAHNGWEALRLARMENVGVILCDLFMPGMNGWQVIAHLRNALPETPVILLTGFLDDIKRDMDRQIQNFHIAAVLFKPVSLQQLVEAVAPHVGHKDMRTTA